MKKLFRILSITENFMLWTNQRIGIFEMTPIRIENFIHDYSYNSNRSSRECEGFVVVWGSALAVKLIDDAKKGKVVEIDEDDFDLFNDNKKVVEKNTYYHKDVVLIERPEKLGDFTLAVIKDEGEFIIKLNGNYSIAMIDASFKDICIQLQNEKKSNIEKFVHDEEGYFYFRVQDYKRELTESEKVKIEKSLLPSSEVICQHRGFGFEELQSVIQDIYSRLPVEVASRLMYSVDFIRLRYW